MPPQFQGGPYQGGPVPYAQPKKKGSGCGVAIALVLIVGLVVVVAAGGLIFMAGQQTSADADDSVDDPGRKKRKAEGVAARVPATVGKYERKSKESADIEGATSVIEATYEKGDAKVNVTLSVFDDSSDAHRHLLATSEKVRSKGGGTREIRPISDENGTVVGQAVHFPSDPEVLAYRVEDEVTVIRGPQGKVMPFFEQLPN